MNKKDYTGWQDVFKFSLEQGIKAKSFTISLAIMCLLLFTILPAITLFSNREKKAVGQTEITNLYVYDETGLTIDYSKALMDERYEGLTVNSAPKKTVEEYTLELDEAETPTDALLKITHDKTGSFQLTYIKAAKSGFSSDDFKAMQDDFLNFFNEAKRDAIEVTSNQEAFINQTVESSVEFINIDENGKLTIAPKEKIEGVSLAEYNILLTAIVVIMMIVNLTGAQIANGIVTEKSTRVIEYLMINVRPLALIVGKILSSLLLVVIQLGGMGISYFAGKLLSNALVQTAVTVADEENSLKIFMEKLGDITAPQILVAVIAILFGVLFFGILAGLAGASVSKIEELTEGMKTYQFTLIIGCYIGIGVCIMQMVGNVNPNIVNALCMLPISAPFLIPANLLLGKINLIAAIIGTAILAICTVVMFIFTSKVYESMIFYNGNVLKFKDILQIAKNRNGVKKEEK